MSGYVMGRLHDGATEVAALRCAIGDTELFRNHIEPGDFGDLRLGATWAAGRHLLTAGRPVTFDTLTDELERVGVEAPVALVNDLYNGGYESPAYFDAYAETIKRWARYRQATGLVGLLAIPGDGGQAPDTDAMLGALIERAQGLRAKAQSAENLPLATWADLPALLGPIVWDWPGWLVRGMLVELVASSGMGKSNLALRIAGTYICGWPWPDGMPYRGDTGSVLWCEAEAAQKLNLDRAQAWGLPLDRLYTPLQSPLDEVDLFSAAHRAAIAARAHLPEVKLIVVDSLSGASGGRERGEDQMPIVKFFAELARDTNKPVLLLHHLRKKSLVDGVGDVVTLDMVRGATQITQMARVIWAMDAPNGNDLEHKRLHIIKNNLARFAEAIGLRIEDNGLSFDDAPIAPRPDSPVNRAVDLLRTLLEHGPVAVRKIEEEAEGAAVSMKAMREAKEALHVLALRKGSGAGAFWLWSLPAILPKE